MLPWRCPAYRWRDLGPGSYMEQENSSPGPSVPLIGGAVDEEA